VKLDIPLFNVVLEQVRNQGPDPEFRTTVGNGEALGVDNKPFADYLSVQMSLILSNPFAAIVTNFQLAFEAGRQYSKVSREVEELNQMVGGERCD
jgi:hypothetical protein